MGNAVNVTRVLLAGDSLLRHYWRDHSIKGRRENTFFLYNFFCVDLLLIFFIFFAEIKNIQNSTKYRIST